MEKQRSNPSRSTIAMQSLTFSEAGETHVLVNAKLAQRKITLIVDTGCSLTALHSDIPHGGTPIALSSSDQTAFAVNGAIDSYSIVKIDSLTIGRLHLPPTIVSLIDLGEVKNFYLERFDIRIDGLLGCDILTRHRATINFAKRTISLYNTTV